ncbi:MAG: PAS domain S-box protein [Robiginitomaculum sp.]|nr:PAS domain S-box protein [Robiginitomaculum sp.]
MSFFKKLKRTKDVTRTNAEIVGALNRGHAIIEFNLDGTIITANKNFLKSVGYSLEEITGQHHSMFVSDEHKTSAKYKELWQDLNSGKNVAGIFERFNKQGDTLWLDASYTSVLDETDTPFKVVKIASDVTGLQMSRCTNAGLISAISENQAIIEFTMDGKVTKANDNFCATMGYGEEEVLGEHHSKFVSKEYRKSTEYEEFWAKLRSGETVAGIFDRYTKDGSLVKLEAAYNTVIDASGKPFKVVKIASDVTKAVEQQTVSTFKGSSFDGSSMAMMVVDRDLMVTFVNQSSMELFSDHAEAFKDVFPNFDPKNIVGTCIDIFQKHPEHQRKLLANPSKMPFRTDISVGDLKFSLSFSTVMDASGNHVGNSLEWDHVTEARTNSGIMSALDRDQSIIEFNLDGTLITANENFLKATGYSISEIVGKHHRIFVSERARSSSNYNKFWDKMNAGKTMSGEYEYFGKQGQSVWLNVSYTPVVDVNGKVFRIVNIANNVTEAHNNRSRSEAELASHAEEQALVVSTLASGLNSLAEGDLNSKIDQAFSGEYEKLRTDFNAAVTKLNSTMGPILTNAVGIQTGASEMSQASEDLATRTENQAAALEETAAALDEVTATVQQTAKSAEKANSVVGVTKTNAEKSGLVVENAFKAMSEIKTSSNEISKIIGVIDEIAFQTNLLALNAGVEAARAGEAGRGFAVVASEVRALAQRSSDAAKDIKTLITTSGKHVEHGVKLVGETGKALGGIVDSVAEISELVSDIAASAQEQATGLGEVNTAINEMDKTTQQNAAMVEESTAACHTLTNDAEEMTALVRQFDIGTGGIPNSVTSINTQTIPAGGGASPVAAQQKRAATYFAATQGSNALDLEMDSEEDNDWQDF